MYLFNFSRANKKTFNFAVDLNIRMANALASKDMYSYEIELEGNKRNLIVNCFGSLYYPSIEDNDFYMSLIITALVEVGYVSNIILSAHRNYIYDEEQTEMLFEIAQIYSYLVREEKVLNITKLAPTELEKKFLPDRMNDMREIVLELLRKDPIGAYVKAVRELREQTVKMKVLPEKSQYLFSSYIKILEIIVEPLAKSKIIQRSKNVLAGHKVGDRTVYRDLFTPIIKPNFMLTRLMAETPMKGVEIDSYTIGKDDKSDVTIYTLPDTIRPLYHLNPPEFNLSEEENSLLDDAQRVLSKYKPKGEEFVDPQRMREVFFNISRDLIDELAISSNIKLSFKDIEKLSRILVRLTVGFGVIELLLEDEGVEDIYVNAPIGTTAIYVKHGKYGECETNVIPNIREAEAWASRFRMISQRPLDEATPVLDTELVIPAARARVAVIQRPLSPSGHAFTFRRHKATPFTLPQYINNRALSPMACGLLWFLADGARSMMLAGTRGSGKTSLLTAILTELKRKHRIITVEDTLEIPVDYLRKIGYNVIPMKVRSAILGEKSELSAAEGVRTSLRLGDSCLIMGEVRGEEALALYEAMRVGALANLVAGTINGDTPYGVFDRVVNDLKVPRTSFKATDIIMIANKLKSADGLKEFRRVTQITEVRKHWEEDPLREQGFANLMEYDAKTDMLVPTSALFEGESEVVKSVAEKTNEWVGNWDRVWSNIQLRAKIKEMMANYSKGTPWIAEADFNVVANDNFHRIFANIQEETGYPENKDVLFEFESWLKGQIRTRKVL